MLSTQYIFLQYTPFINSFLRNLLDDGDPSHSSPVIRDILVDEEITKKVINKLNKNDLMGSDNLKVFLFTSACGLAPMKFSRKWWTNT